MIQPNELYSGREQTWVKHFILSKYLERFARIVGSSYEKITYVDCFYGPWNARSENLEDSSFFIALRELRNARQTLSRTLGLRCFFLEKKASSYRRLKEFAETAKDAEIETRNASLEESVPEIVSFAKGGGRRSFPFIFIDPTGWTGFEMATIAPLLQLDPGEVLINFMTGHIKRFLESPDLETQESFERLFGSGNFRARIAGLAPKDREDEAVKEYVANAKKVGGFNFGCTAIVLNPEQNKTHFNLIYLTRNPKGVEVFKDAEKKAMEVQEAARAAAGQRRREERSGQIELLGSSDLHDSGYYGTLRERYLGKAQSLIKNGLIAKRRLLYDEAWQLGISEPMFWESDLKAWIEDWKREGLVEVELQPGQRVPNRERGNVLIWKK